MKYKNHDVPGFHDGYLHGIVNIADELCLLVSSVHGLHKAIVMRGLKEFRESNFLPGNIILDLEVFSGNANDAVFLGVVQDYFNEINYDIPISSLKEYSDFVFLSIQSSYGCDLCAISDSIEIIDVDKEFRVLIK